MIANRHSEQSHPLTWVGRVPVYLATILAAVQAVSMILTALAQAVGGPLVAGNSLLAPLTFSYAAAIGNLKLWQFVSYAFVNPPDLFFVIQLFLFAWFGSEVEKFLGRKSFALLCGLLLVGLPALLAGLGLLGMNLGYQGAGALNFAIFLAFAVIYPRAEIFFGIEARWIAVILLGVNSLQCLAFHAWTQFLMLWWGLALVLIWLKFEGLAALEARSLSGLFVRRRSQRNLKIMKKEQPEDPGPQDSVDPILEKIARQGIGSLSRSEREKLERARTALLEKERGR